MKEQALKSRGVENYKIVGCINLGLVVIFLLLYLMDPSLFSKDTTINNSYIYVAFSILASYYYILAAPLSIASALIMLKNKSEKKLYYT